MNNIKTYLKIGLLPIFSILVPAIGNSNSDTEVSGQVSAESTSVDTRNLSIEAYKVKRGLTNLTKRAQVTRERLSLVSEEILAAAPIALPTAVEGSIEIPILLSMFIDTDTQPFESENLQKQLFDGPWPSRTMREHYKEMSQSKLDVSGFVGEWVTLSAKENFYTGPIGCNGTCNQGNLGTYLVSTLSLYDNDIDFSKYDNDGPDGVADSGDDDGFVDFVAFVHPAKGGECNDGSGEHIWSHRYSIAALTGNNYITNDSNSNSGKILIDDYVIMPGLSCDESSMIQIGVFSHEFAHAFGLPDLYDSKKPVTSSGIGGWGLMASGSWGGNGSSNPESPTHLSAWSKEYLGWIAPIVVDKDAKGVEINEYVISGDVVRVDYSNSENPADDSYLLLSLRTKVGFDKSLVNEGLLVEEIKNDIVTGGLVNNSVNGAHDRLGVNIIEADGKRDLDLNVNRADAGDVFPGTSNVNYLDKTSSESVSAALCNIKYSDKKVKLDIYVSRTVCPSSLKEAASSPENIREKNDAFGKEVIVDGTLLNIGSNLMTDRKLILRSPTDGSEMYVLSPEIFGSTLSNNAASSPDSITDYIGERLIVRGEIRKMVIKGLGEVDVLISEEHSRY